jgi:alpha-beta hydrolase superfamily lysophospholipase
MPPALTRLLCVVAALAVGACATSRPSGGAPQAPAGSPPATSAPATQKPAAPGAPPAVPAPVRRTATARDGTRIAYEMEGKGPALILVHGGGQTGRSWTERGYLAPLRERFTVIALDLRGYGESGKPATPEAYALDRVLDDIIAVADAAKAERFHLWGFGHGATIGRYLAARSDRVISAVLVGANLGAPLEGVVKDAITGMRAKWLPLVQAQMAGTLKVDTLSSSDRTAWDAGSADASAMENVKAYEGKLAGTSVTLKLLNGATYTDSFGKSELSLAEAVPFLTTAR